MRVYSAMWPMLLTLLAPSPLGPHPAVADTLVIEKVQCVHGRQGVSAWLTDGFKALGAAIGGE